MAVPLPRMVFNGLAVGVGEDCGCVAIWLAEARSSLFHFLFHFMVKRKRVQQGAPSYVLLIQNLSPAFSPPRKYTFISTTRLIYTHSVHDARQSPSGRP